MKSLNTNLVLLAATTLVVAACSSSNKSPPMGPSGAVNQPPTVSAIADQTADQDTTIGPLTFSLADDRSDVAVLTAVATTAGTDLFPADGLVVSGTGASRKLTLTPYEAATGTAVIALQVRDAEAGTSIRTFKVTVNAKPASVRDVSVNTFAKGETDDATVVNGLTFTQDADDPAIFDPLIASQP